MPSLLILSRAETDQTVEVVERKGIGHPDTICDALAETLSRNLCREYRRRFGRILHHNVDKALLCGGQSTPVFGGGVVTAPIGLYLAGRAMTGIGGDAISVEDIAREGSRDWLTLNLHALDAVRDVQIHTVIRPSSQDLQSLFERHERVPLANDTSFGVGHAPLSSLGELVLELERSLHRRDRHRVRPEWGEDVKVMAVRVGRSVRLTIACAMIARHLAHLDDYLAAKSSLAEYAQRLAGAHGFGDCRVEVNAADDIASGRIYLTVTGTSAEAGDDGQVGRGNRVNGLITPGSPMSLEAAAGKNPVSHVGKIYNVAAPRIANAIVSSIPDIAAADCLLVSRIGQPIEEPEIVRITAVGRDGAPVDAFRQRIEEIVLDHLGKLEQLVDAFIDGVIDVY